MRRKRVAAFSLRMAATIWLTALSVVGLAVSVSETPAESYRYHEAHEHGVANLNVAVDGSNLYIEFSSPAANIVGFEHLPRTQKQKAAVVDATKKLKQGHTLFLLPSESMSRLVDVSVKTDIERHTEHQGETGHSGEREDHHTEKEKHHEADEHGRHSEFQATYHFISKNPKKLSQIKVQLMAVFPGIEHIKDQVLSETKQTAMELTAKQNTISL